MPPANQAPVFEVLPTLSVDENSASLVAVGDPVAATDPDGDQLTYTLNDPAGLFTIDPDTGQISTIGVPLDHETTPVLFVTIIATDPDGDTDSTIVIIDVDDTNDAPTITTPPTLSTEENSASLVAVGDPVAATDPDGDQLTYTLNDPAGLFTIDPDTGQISTIGVPLDHETTPVLFVTIIATDPDGDTDSTIVIIDVDDTNDAPTITTPPTLSTEENQTTDTIGTLNATDEDGDPLTWILTGEGAENFTINNNGVITLRNPLDHEDTAQFTLNAIVDDGTTTTSVLITIDVEDVDEPPTIKTPQTFLIPESASPNTPVSAGAVTVNNPTNETLAWELGPTNGTFVIDGGGQIALAPGATLDFETVPFYAVEVTVTGDTSGLSSTEVVRISVMDNNEAPTIQVTGNGSVAENLPAGVPVENLSIDSSDPDAHDLEFFIIGGNGANEFEIDSTSGVISTTRTFDAEAPITLFDLQVEVREATLDELFASTSIQITITNVNEPPAIGPDQTFSILEDQDVQAGSSGIPIGNVAVSDVDVDDSVSLQITGGSGANFFTIDQNNQLNALTSFDATDAQSYDLIIEATDSGSPALSTTETVTVEIITTLFGLSPSPFAGQIVFNEVEFDSQMGDDFVEIYNASNQPIDISRWFLLDHPLGIADSGQANGPIGLTSSSTTTFAPGEHAIFWMNHENDVSQLVSQIGHPFSFFANGNIFGPRADQATLQLNDDVFLYDAAGRLVAYMAWGDTDAPQSQIFSITPPRSWNLWDPTYQQDLSPVQNQSISLVPNGTNSHLSGCWERTESGDAADAGRCPTSGVGTSINTGLISSGSSPTDSNGP